MRRISAWRYFTRNLLGDAGVGFDLDAPGGVEQGGDDDHGGGGADEREEFAVDPPGDFPVLGVGEIDACAVDVLDGAAGVFERGGDEAKALRCLFGDICVVGTYGAGSGDVDFVANADGSGEADDGLVRAGAGNIGASHGISLCPADKTACSLPIDCVHFGLSPTRVFLCKVFKNRDISPDFWFGLRVKCEGPAG